MKVKEVVIWSELIECCTDHTENAPRPQKTATFSQTQFLLDKNKTKKDTVSTFTVHFMVPGSAETNSWTVW